MDKGSHQIQAPTRFSESLIWQLNRDFYTQTGVDAWRKGIVPHYLSSNSKLAKAYAELIFAFLKDLAKKGQTEEPVYILELGAGHGRLAFHILKHLEPLTQQVGLNLPPFCYVLSDIVEENLSFFEEHDQFQPYFEQGILEVAYFDGLASDSLELRKSKVLIKTGELSQPLIGIANYFFDSLPIDLFYIKEQEIFDCSISLQTPIDPTDLEPETVLKLIEFSYHLAPHTKGLYEETYLNDLLESYRDLLSDAYLFFPHTGLACVNNLRKLSQQGLMLLSVDKGFHEIHDLQKAQLPEMITHGSLSFWVNYHAYASYCQQEGGQALFSEYSTFSMEMGCMLFLSDTDAYAETFTTFDRFVNDYGPDDFNGLKKFVYKHLGEMNLLELIGVIRLSAYDSTLFVDVLPRIKELCKQVTINERRRLAQTLHKTWEKYFTLRESKDIAFEIAGIFYELGFYQEALTYYNYSLNLFGHTRDGFYNRALCHYQLREDELFVKTVKEGKATYPEFEKFAHLDTLDLTAT